VHAVSPVEEEEGLGCCALKTQDFKQASSFSAAVPADFRNPVQKNEKNAERAGGCAAPGFLPFFRAVRKNSVHFVLVCRRSGRDPHRKMPHLRRDGPRGH
jgi:hypothetical protein